LAIGSLLVNRVLDNRRDLLLGFAAVEAGIAFSAIAVSFVLGRLPAFVAQMTTERSGSFRSLYETEFGLVFGLILLPTMLMGVSFPLAATSCSRIAARVGRAVGDVYAANTLGAIVGAFTAGFLLIPTLGTERSIFVAVALNVAAAVIVFLVANNFSSLAKRALFAAAGCAVFAVACTRVPRWNTVLLAAGPYLYASQYQQLATAKGISLEEAMTEGRDLVFFEDGLHAAVSVAKTLEDDLLLGVNGKTDGTARGDAPTQLMVGHLPLLLRPEAKDVLIIGLGTGMTLGAVERHPVRTIDVVEIEPAVVHASALFNAFTGSPLKDPRARLVVGDGRNFMALTDRRYDVVISEPSNPWVAGMASLFTRESFEAARAHLRPGGVMCQWVHAYSMSPADFKTIVATFADVFPNATLWEADLGNDYLLIGAIDSARVDPATLGATLRRVELKSDLATIGATDVPSFVEKLLLDRDALRVFARGARLHTDDNARLEYSAPRALLGARSSALIEEIYRDRARPAAQFAALGWSNPTRALADTLERNFAAQSEIVAGYLSFANFDVNAAVEHLNRARSMRPDSFQAAYLLAKLYHELGDQSRAQSADRAREAYQKSVAVLDDDARRNSSVFRDHFLMGAEYAEANLALGTLFMQAAQLDSASAAFHRSLAADVRYPEAYNNLGVIFERRGQLDSAQAEYAQAMAAHPKYVPARMNLGNISLGQHKYDEAMERYREVLQLRPDYAPAYYNLGVVHFAKREWRQAESDWARALELKPDFEQARASLVVVRDSLARAVR
jgi:spermidine synthase